MTWQSAAGFDTAPGLALTEPELLRSSGGGLQVTLRAAQGPTRVAGRDSTTLSYNGGLPGPTLYLQPGDRLQVRLVNDLDAPTNLHVHGLYVSPAGNGDNAFVVVQPGESFDYDHQLPDDHPPGVYWYHPHHHGMVADQVFGGLYGAIVVGDPEPVAVTRERVLVISDLTLDGSGRVSAPSAMARMAGREGELLLINGQSRPVLTARPGERERWRIVNACSARYLRLRLDGQQLQLLGLDSGRYPEPRDVEGVVLAPGNRSDLLVTANEGSGVLQALPYDRGGTGGMMAGSTSSDGAGITLATLDVTGAAVAALPPVATQPSARDLRGLTVGGRRDLTFAMGMGGGGVQFTIDGKVFDPERVDQAVQLGTVEEWTLTNASSMDHPMHLHVWPMQVVAEGGKPLDEVMLRDVVNIPAGSQVTVRVAFDRYPGRTVYHCHILDHEDNGMMGVLTAT
ncbi:multicopper oxidase family protein [Blastococcus sp. CT_GayMR16]|uniref:multicopper oxidase family protein n=1 Tax=Blastococcus sp. CT_GayMR16 TaxID=2559607 RepID=UPI001FD76436|nr:multicopper oxidase family protein [Blastococcus sp. CT_GayMR16]